MKKVGVVGLLAVVVGTLGACAVDPVEATGAGESAVGTLNSPDYCLMKCAADAYAPSPGRILGVKPAGASFDVFDVAIINGNTAVADYGDVTDSDAAKSAMVKRHVFADGASAAARKAAVIALEAALDKKQACSAGWTLTSFDGDRYIGFTCKNDIRGSSGTDETYCAKSIPTTRRSCPLPAPGKNTLCIATKPTTLFDSAGNVVRAAACATNFIVKPGEQTQPPGMTTGMTHVRRADANCVENLYPNAGTFPSQDVYVPTADLFCVEQGSPLWNNGWGAAADAAISACPSYSSPGDADQSLPEAPTKSEAKKGTTYANGSDFKEAYVNQHANGFEFWGTVNYTGTFRCGSLIDKDGNSSFESSVCVWPKKCGTKNVVPGSRVWCAYYAPGSTFYYAK